MNCYLHPDTAAVAFCRTCGRPLCSLCQRPVDGTVFCQEHAPVAAYADPGRPYADPANPFVPPTANPYVQPVPPPGAVHSSPGLAFLLGLIPGVGAIYNGQYLKGLVHAVIFGLLMSLSNSADNTAGQPILIMVATAFYLYMPFEAYHTARKRQLGAPIEEWSSLLSSTRFSGSAPIGPVILILIGVLFLLDSLHVIPFREVGRFWPVILIVIGAWMLYSRLTGGRALENLEPPRPNPLRPNAPASDIAEAPRER
jgi:TM2 domain-containing membrane protein YozV